MWTSQTLDPRNVRSVISPTTTIKINKDSQGFAEFFQIPTVNPDSTILLTFRLKRGWWSGQAVPTNVIILCMFVRADGAS